MTEARLINKCLPHYHIGSKDYIPGTNAVPFQTVNDKAPPSCATGTFPERASASRIDSFANATGKTGKFA